MSKRSLGATAQRHADKEYREIERSRARHNRRMKTDPEYRDAFVARRVNEGERRHLAHIKGERAKDARLLLALFGLDAAEVA